MTGSMNPLIFSSRKWTLFFLNLHFAPLAFTDLFTSSVWPKKKEICPSVEETIIFNNIIHNLSSTVLGNPPMALSDHAHANAETWTVNLGCLHTMCVMGHVWNLLIYKPLNCHSGKSSHPARCHSLLLSLLGAKL